MWSRSKQLQDLILFFNVFEYMIRYHIQYALATPRRLIKFSYYPRYKYQLHCYKVYYKHPKHHLEYFTLPRELFHYILSLPLRKQLNNILEYSFMGYEESLHFMWLEYGALRCIIGLEFGIRLFIVGENCI